MAEIQYWRPQRKATRIDLISVGWDNWISSLFQLRTSSYPVSFGLERRLKFNRCCFYSVTFVCPLHIQIRMINDNARQCSALTFTDRRMKNLATSDIRDGDDPLLPEPG